MKANINSLVIGLVGALLTGFGVVAISVILSMYSFIVIRGNGFDFSNFLYLGNLETIYYLAILIIVFGIICIFISLFEYIRGIKYEKNIKNIK